MPVTIHDEPTMGKTGNAYFAAEMIGGMIHPDTKPNFPYKAVELNTATCSIIVENVTNGNRYRLKVEQLSGTV